MQEALYNYIQAHYYLVYAAPLVISGIALIVYSMIEGNKVWAINKAYWKQKQLALGVNRTTSLKGTALSFREKKALKAIESGAVELVAKLRLARLSFWVGFAFLTIGVIWGYAMKLQLISYL